ncbi:MAG: hypothetical protein ACK5MW_04880 [Enterococcus sp.]
MIIRLSYLLRHWFHYQKHINDLEDYERKNARLLFNALKKLDREDVAFLGEKYLKGASGGQWSRYHEDYTTKTPVTDAALADSFGIKMQAYRKKRIKIEQQLSKAVFEVADELRERDAQAFICRAGNCLYFERYDQFTGSYIFTIDKTKAYVFGKEENPIHGLKKEFIIND